MASQPTLSEVHVSVPLTNISVAYIQARANFKATQIFPIVPVMKQADLYWTYDKDNWFRSDAEERAPGTETPGTGYTFNANSNYYARVYGIHKDIPDMIRSNADSALNLDREATELTVQQLLQKREALWSSNFFATSIWTGDQTGVTGTPSTNQFKRWDQAGSTPIEDVTTQILAVQGRTSFKPNTFVCDPYTKAALRNNAEIVDRVKYTHPDAVYLSDQLIAQALGVERLIELEAVTNTATEGATNSLGFLFPKGALLCYVTPSPGLMTPTAGYTFSWQGYLNGNAEVVTKKYPMLHLEADRIESAMAFDMKVIGADLGVFFATPVS